MPSFVFLSFSSPIKTRYLRNGLQPLKTLNFKRVRDILLTYECASIRSVRGPSWSAGFLPTSGGSFSTLSLTEKFRYRAALLWFAGRRFDSHTPGRKILADKKRKNPVRGEGVGGTHSFRQSGQHNDIPRTVDRGGTIIFSVSGVTNVAGPRRATFAIPAAPRIAS